MYVTLDVERRGAFKAYVLEITIRRDLAGTDLFDLTVSITG